MRKDGVTLGLLTVGVLLLAFYVLKAEKPRRDPRIIEQQEWSLCVYQVPSCLREASQNHRLGSPSPYHYYFGAVWDSYLGTETLDSRCDGELRALFQCLEATIRVSPEWRLWRRFGSVELRKGRLYVVASEMLQARLASVLQNIEKQGFVPKMTKR